MDILHRDLRLAVRQLRRSPAFTVLAVASLAIGIGATTTIFSLADALLLRPLPLRDAGRLVYAYETSGDGTGFHSFSFPQYRDLRDRTRALAGLAAFDVAPLSVGTGGGEPRITLGYVVSGNYFRVLGTTPALGRFFLAEEDAVPGARPVAVVSHAFWRQRLGGDPAAVGRAIRVNGRAFTVVGVTRPEFAHVSALLAPDVWTPTMMAPVTRPELRLDARDHATFQLVGRLADGVDRARAERELEGIARHVEREHPESAAGEGRGVDLHPFTALTTEARRGVALFTALLMTFAALILLVACGNLASMLLARAVHRRRELAIRAALGSGRGRLVRQLVTETVVLFMAGAGAAVLLAAFAARALAAFRPPVDVPIALDVPIDGRVLAFAAAVALVVGSVFGLLPALRATRGAVAPVLKETGGGVAARSRARALLVVGQVAFTFLLLVGAGLVGRALRSALDASPGFDRHGLYLASTSLQMAAHDAAGAARLVASWEERVAALPGVAGAALTTRAPLGLGNSTTGYRPDDAAADARFEDADWAAVSPSYFATLRVPLLAGRAFAVADGRGAPRVVVVSAALARRHFGDPARALGRVLRFGREAGDRATIVGVAADTRVRSLVEAPRAFVYEPLAQTRVREVSLLARAAPGAPDVVTNAALGPAIRGALRALDPDLPLMSAMPYERHVAVALLPQRLAATVAATLGAAGLLLAVVGVYGIVAYAVSQRTREIGLRVAVGASARAVVARMAAEGVRLVVAGLGLGLVLALAGTRLMRAFLLGVSPTDPLTFGAIAVGLAAAAVAACALPARRAARVDPMVALRAE